MGWFMRLWKYSLRNCKTFLVGADTKNAANECPDTMKCLGQMLCGTASSK